MLVGTGLLAFNRGMNVATYVKQSTKAQGVALKAPKAVLMSVAERICNAL